MSKLFVFMPEYIPLASVFVDYPELRGRRKDVVKIAHRDDIMRTYGIRGAEYIWYAGGPNDSRTIQEFQYRQAGPWPFEAYTPLSDEVRAELLKVVEDIVLYGSGFFDPKGQVRIDPTEVRIIRKKESL